MLPLLRSQRGALLPVVIVALVISGLVMSTWTYLYQNLEELSRTRARLERERLQQTLSALMVPEICTCQMTQTIDPDNLVDITFNQIRSSCDLTATDNKVIAVNQDGVMAIAIKNMTKVSQNGVKGDLTVNRVLDRPGMAPAKVSVFLTLDSSAPGASKPVTSCISENSTVGGSIQNCPAGYTLVGTPGILSAFCIGDTPAQGTFQQTGAGCPMLNDPKYIQPRFCTHRYWYEACKAGVFTPSQWEWSGARTLDWSTDTNVVSAGEASVIGGGPGGCESFAGAPIAEVHPYRCCIFSSM